MTKRTKADSPTKTCTLTGCDRALRARGLCATHYNQQHHPDRHAAKPTTCTACGVHIMRPHKSERRPTCSPKCRHALSGHTYTQQYNYTANGKERARAAGATILEDINNTDVFERDGWTCYICEQPVDRTADCFDPKSPTVDHVTPLSKGGQHTMENVRLACLGCNSSKQAGEAVRTTQMDGFVSLHPRQLAGV